MPLLICSSCGIKTTPPRLPGDGPGLGPGPLGPVAGPGLVAIAGDAAVAVGPGLGLGLGLAAIAGDHSHIMDGLAVADLKKKAEDLGIKVPGTGWPTCCPPNGTKADIITAIRAHQGGGGGGGGGGQGVQGGAAVAVGPVGPGPVGLGPGLAAGPPGLGPVAVAGDAAVAIDPLAAPTTLEQILACKDERPLVVVLDDGIDIAPHGNFTVKKTSEPRDDTIARYPATTKIVFVAHTRKNATVPVHEIIV
jgi:hypothetical protein